MPRKTSSSDCAAVHPRLFVPPSLQHLTESAHLGAILARTVEACHRTGQRLPHTLLWGPADSGKRAIARLLAAELATDVIQVDVATLSGAAELHAALAGANDRDIVLVVGLDACTLPALRDIARAAARMRPDFEEDGGLYNASRTHGAHGTHGPHGAHGDPDGVDATPRRRPRYCKFTIVATARTELCLDAVHFAWIERRYFLQRTEATESARMDRALRRLGIALEPAALELLARTSIEAGMRTLEAVALVTDWLRAQGLRTADAAALEQELAAAVQHCAPRRGG